MEGNAGHVRPSRTAVLAQPAAAESRRREVRGRLRSERLRTPRELRAFTVVATDVTGDGYPDLYIACDSTPSLLYVNRADGTFEEQGLLAGVALNADGQEQGGMGVAVADYDGDGRMDIGKTNFSDDVPNLYRNNGDGSFDDRVFQSGLGANMQHVGWGIHFADVDHDGLRDLLMVNGHVYPEAERLPGQYRQPRQLYWNVGGRFKEISGTAGPGIREAWSSRGSAAGDLDNDGSLEIVVSNIGNRPSLLKNLGRARTGCCCGAWASGPIEMRSEPW